jgi:UDP-N-acetylmuramate--alanine ligase
MDEFAKSFHQADVVYVLDIYAASEEPIQGITGQALAQRIRDFGHRCVEYTGTIEQTAVLVAEKVRDKDLVLTLGAGNVWQVGERVLEKLREAS